MKFVSTQPGQSAVTLIFRDRSSAPSASEKWRTNAFVAAYTLNPGIGRNDAADAISMIFAPELIYGNAAYVVRTSAVTFRSIIPRASSKPTFV